MSDSSYGGPPADPAGWMPPTNQSAHGASRVPVIAALVMSLAALALAAAAWFKPTHPESDGKPQYSEQQVADAKKNLCDAYETMFRAIKSAGSLSSEDPNVKFMVSLNTRLAFNSGADYLLAKADENPQAPEKLIRATRSLAIAYQKIVLGQTEPLSPEALKPLYEAADSEVTTIKQECG